MDGSHSYRSHSMNTPSETGNPGDVRVPLSDVPGRNVDHIDFVRMDAAMSNQNRPPIERNVLPEDGNPGTTVLPLRQRPRREKSNFPGMGKFPVSVGGSLDGDMASQGESKKRTYRPVPKGITTNARIEERLKANMRAADPGRSDQDIAEAVEKIKAGFKFINTKRYEKSADSKNPDRRKNVSIRRVELTPDEVENRVSEYYRLWNEARARLIAEARQGKDVGGGQIERGTDDTSHFAELPVSSDMEAPHPFEDTLRDSTSHPGWPAGFPDAEASPASMLYMSPYDNRVTQGEPAGFPDMEESLASMHTLPDGGIYPPVEPAIFPGMGEFQVSMDVSLDGDMVAQGESASFVGDVFQAPMYMSPDSSMYSRDVAANFSGMGGFPALGESPYGYSADPLVEPSVSSSIEEPLHRYVQMLSDSVAYPGGHVGLPGRDVSATYNAFPDNDLFSAGEVVSPFSMGTSPASMYMSPDGGMNLQGEAASLTGLEDSQALNANSHGSWGGFQGYDGHYNNASGQDAYTQAALATWRRRYGPSYPGATSDYPQEDQG